MVNTLENPVKIQTALNLKLQCHLKKKSKSTLLHHFASSSIICFWQNQLFFPRLGGAAVGEVEEEGGGA